MSFSKEYIIDTVGGIVKKDALPPNKNYEWIDFVGIPQRPENTKNLLYCATYSSGDNGWDNGFDRRVIVNKVADEKDWDVVTDSSISTSKPFLGVNSIRDFCDKIYQRSKDKHHPFVIGVTGSVGKTTTVAFLEHLLSGSKIDTVRFYSKRLNPLSVMCHFVNRVDDQTSAIVMEYSAYMKDHIKLLANLLPPDLAFLTNIYETHINPGMFSDKNEIFDSKIGINNNSKCFLNTKIVESLNISCPKNWSRFDAEEPEVFNPSLPPTTRTSELYTVGKIVAANMNIAFSSFLEAFKTFVPKENRILPCFVNNEIIYFHGETSGGSRLVSWFETHNDRKPWFFVEELNFADEDPNGFSVLLEKVFSSEKTFVLDIPINRDRLHVKANFIKQEDFLSKLRNEAKGYIVYHKALATRNKTFSAFNYLKNLLS